MRGPRAEARYPPPGLAGSQLVGAAGRVGEPLGAPAARPGEVVVDNPYDGSEAARVRLLGASEAVAQAAFRGPTHTHTSAGAVGSLSL